MDDEKMNQIVADALRTARNDALEYAAEICDEVFKLGHDAKVCAMTIRGMKNKLSQPGDPAAAPSDAVKH